MSLKNLAESIILQSVEDLWDKRHSSDCMTFFKGEGFDICSRLAGIELQDRLKLLELIYGLTDVPI